MPVKGANSREAVLDAAESVFADLGFDGATFSDICAAADVSRGLPSYLFGSKDQLYREVVDRAATHLRSAVTEPLRSGQSLSLEALTHRFIETYIEYLSRNERIVRLLQWELLSDPRSSRPYAPSSALFAEMYEIIDEAARRERSAVDVRALLGSMVALCFFPFVMRDRVKAQTLYDGSKKSIASLKRHASELISAHLRGQRHA